MYPIWTSPTEAILSAIATTPKTNSSLPSHKVVEVDRPRNEINLPHVDEKSKIKQPRVRACNIRQPWLVYVSCDRINASSSSLYQCQDAIDERQNRRDFLMRQSQNWSFWVNLFDDLTVGGFCLFLVDAKVIGRLLPQAYRALLKSWWCGGHVMSIGAKS